MNRYHRQILLAQIGEAGQAKLAAARVLLIGCGALGSHIAEQLVRAGVGFLRIADRDIVELTNLQRQVLFDENDARRDWPKAVAAAERLAEINSTVTIEPHVLDVDWGNIEALAGLIPSPGTPGEGQGGGLGPAVHLILDGTDNVATRYLINDVAVKHNVPWVYGACVGVEGRVMVVRPGISPCLRCIFLTPPRAEELVTCDTAGVLGAAAAIVGSLQAVAAIKLLTGNHATVGEELLTVDLWSNRFANLSLRDSRGPDCICCGQRRFAFLSRQPQDSPVTLCGRDAVQVRGQVRVELRSLADRWRALGAVEQNRFFVRCRLTEPADTMLTLFADGRLIVQGTRDLSRAKSLYARFVGA